MNLEAVLIEDRQHDTLLSAGRLQVRITDWFIFKKQAELKYLGLEDAVINLQRSDSVWNYQFLVDYFSGPSTGTGQKQGIQFTLRTIVLHHVRIRQADRWRGETLTGAVGSLVLNANQLDLDRKQVDIGSLEITDPEFAIQDYPGLRAQSPDSTLPEKPAPNQLDTLLRWNPDDWKIRVARLDIQNGLFTVDQQTDRDPYPYFDGQHIRFQQINARIRDLSWLRDTISANLDLNTSERSGFAVASLKARVKMTPERMAFSDLYIRTAKSEIRDYFAMKYADFSDMDDFIHRIVMEARFTDSQIDSDDIAYFAPDAASWKKQIRVNGLVKGTVDQLSGTDLNIRAGSRTYLNGDINLTGLPDIDQTFIDFRARDFGTTYEDAARFVPSIRSIGSVHLEKIGYLHFTGNFTGFIRDFVTYGTLETNLGTLKSDLNMKLPRGNEPVYSGNLSTAGFDLGGFLGNSSLGQIAFDGVVKGRSFNINKITADLDGKISSVYFNGYTYHNIETKSRLLKRLFDGYVSLNDSNAVASLNGIIDFNEKTPQFNFTAEVQKAHLKNLKLTQEDLAFTGKFGLDFSGDNIDDFLGNARISEASLLREGKKLSFDSLVLTSSVTPEGKILSLHSNEIDATLQGRFSLVELPAAVQLFLHRYYPAYIGSVRQRLTREDFHFDVTTRYVDEYIKLLNPGLGGFDNSHIAGEINLETNRLDLVAEVPQFNFRKYQFNNSRLTGKGDLDSLVVYGVSNNIVVDDSLSLPLASARIIAFNDSSYVQIATGMSQALEKANLNALVRTYSNGVGIRFDSSSFVLNGKRWTIDRNGELNFRNNTVASGELRLRESNQEILLETKPSAEGNWNDLLATLHNVNLGDFMPLIIRSPRLEGLLSGKILVEDPYSRFNVHSDLEADQLRVDNDSIGRISLQDITYNKAQGELKATGHNQDPDHNLNFSIDLFPTDSARAASNRIAIRSRNYPIRILDRFLGGLFTDLEGYATADLDITGAFDHLNYIGKAHLHDAGLRVRFTQCFYRLDDGDIDFRKDAIDFTSLKLHDQQGRSATVKRGLIQHESFTNLFFDIEVQTDGEPMELLNTTYSDNQSFYGKARGTGTFFLTGPESDMVMEVYAKASSRDSSYITIPPATARETGIADFLVEKKYGHELSDSVTGSAASKMTYDVELNANPMVNIRMVLDELTGDEIKARGDGTLKIHAGTTEDLTLRGRYNIEQGNYRYSFRSFINKPLVVNPGGNNYIDWNGDPYKATIHIEAQYRAENVSLAPLVSSLQLDPNIAKARSDVLVITTLTGDLFKPTINFKLAFPPGSDASSNAAIGFGLQQIEADPNELYKQVTYLIVLNNFAPLEGRGASTTGISLGETATNTLSGIFFNVLNNEFNKILGKILKSDKYRFNISNTIYNRNFLDPTNKTALNIGSNLNFSVGRSFFNDRFILTFGGGIDAPLGQQTTIQQTVQLLPDVTAEWLINPSGTVRATFFYRENVDYLNTTSTGSFGRTRRAGSSISYRKEFNTLGGSDARKKPARKKAAEKPTANKPEQEEDPQPAPGSD
ncbi:MAG TPA: translocation/assembly module TamB domain-containing protein [Chitinophagaceae bacterium]|nr:translocation/assembly module TamB domain-containing protein [Chitinophagaceae bacterium]